MRGLTMSSERIVLDEAGKLGLVPERRFPDFRGEIWKACYLKELSKFGLSNGVFNDPKKIGAGYRLINVSDMYLDTSIKRDRLSLLDLSVSEFETNRVQSGDIFFTRSSLVKSGIAVSNIYLDDPTDVTFDGHLIRFRPNADKILPLFAHYLFKSAPIRAQLVARGKSATMTTIGQADVASVLVYYPTKDEQQKIVDCLTSADELISAQAEKVEALKAHKKGLMQQFFPRPERTENGQKVPPEPKPRLRFPEFEGAGDWEEKQLGEYASFSSGGTPFKDNPDYWNGSIPWISASSMHDLLVNKADHYVTPQAIGNGTRIAKKGSILILVRGSMLFKRVPICLTGLDVAFNQDVKALNVNANLNRGFLLYHLIAFQSQFQITETGIGAGKIDLEQLKGFKLFIPKLAEQQQVASCLANVDDLITAQSQKLDTLKTHKKALMQQLFPLLGGTVG